MKAWNGFLAVVDGDQTCGLSKKTTKRMLHVHQLPAPGSVLQETEQKIFISGLGVNIRVFFFFFFFFEFHFLTFSCSCLPLGQNTSRRGIVFDCGGPKTQTTDRSVFWIKTQRIRFKVMEWRMEVGRALRVGSRKELWKIVARGRPTRWHLRSANHCLYFLRSKVASSLSLFGVRLPKLELGCFHLE